MLLSLAWFANPNTCAVEVTRAVLHVDRAHVDTVPVPPEAGMTLYGTAAVAFDVGWSPSNELGRAGPVLIGYAYRCADK